MAEKAYTVLSSDHEHALGIRVYQWTLATGDTGAPLILPFYAEKSVQASGTFDSTVITMQGSNEVTSPTWATLRDHAAADLTFSAAGLKEIIEDTYQIRPSAAGGTGTGLKVTMLVINPNI